jgi:hypothetical protein
MKKELKQYTQGGIDTRLFKKWISDNLSDFTSKIYTKKDYDLLIQNPKDKDINKVILFTKKENLTPTVKALAAEFRDRIRFTIISIPEAGKVNPELVTLQEEYEVTDLPKLILEETWDVEKD